MKIYTNVFEGIISLENLFSAYDEFKRDKQNKKDVLNFECHLEENIFELRNALKNHEYRHGAYTKFRICDPKPRIIHKAQVRDRVLHHAIYQILNPIFDPCFISNSFSCRKNKGTHKGVETLAKMLCQVSQNETRPCFALKCDIKKFFDSVDHLILVGIIEKKIKDQNAIWLIREIIESFPPSYAGTRTDYDSHQSSLFGRTGLPIGNLTSQLFANIYLGEFDSFVKHGLKVKNYLRYTDDFLIVENSTEDLDILLPKIERFLEKKLKLSLHPNKVEIRKYRSGVDFLGYVVLPKHIGPRSKTKKGFFRKLKRRASQFKGGMITDYTLTQSLNSYLGTLSHASSFDLQEKLKNHFWFWLSD